VFDSIVAGPLLGALARVVRPGRHSLSLVATLLLGLTGSVIGGQLTTALGVGDTVSLVVSVVTGAMLIKFAQGNTGQRAIVVSEPLESERS